MELLCVFDACPEKAAEAASVTPSIVPHPVVPPTADSAASDLVPFTIPAASPAPYVPAAASPVGAGLALETALAGLRRVRTHHYQDTALDPAPAGLVAEACDVRVAPWEREHILGVLAPPPPPAGCADGKDAGENGGTCGGRVEAACNVPRRLASRRPNAAAGALSGLLSRAFNSTVGASQAWRRQLSGDARLTGALHDYAASSAAGAVPTSSACHGHSGAGAADGASTAVAAPSKPPLPRMSTMPLPELSTKCTDPRDAAAPPDPAHHSPAFSNSGCTPLADTRPARNSWADPVAAVAVGAAAFSTADCLLSPSLPPGGRLVQYGRGSLGALKRSPSVAGCLSGEVDGKCNDGSAGALAGTRNGGSGGGGASSPLPRSLPADRNAEASAALPGPPPSTASRRWEPLSTLLLGSPVAAPTASASAQSELLSAAAAAGSSGGVWPYDVAAHVSRRLHRSSTCCYSTRGGGGHGGASPDGSGNVWGGGWTPDSGTPRAAPSGPHDLPYAEWHPCVSVLFADICGFTQISNRVPAVAVMEMLNALYCRLDVLCASWGQQQQHQQHPCGSPPAASPSACAPVYKVQIIGDAYMVATGLLADHPAHAATACSFALAILREAEQVVDPCDGKPLRLRVGIHSGPVVSGVVGRMRRQYSVFGDTVNVASRMESTGAPGAIHVSEDTQRLAAPYMPAGDYVWRRREGVEVKGKGIMDTYWLEEGTGAQQQG